jgi:small subunit ribosomal protein S7
MPRRRVVVRRKVEADAIFNSNLVAKFINSLMRQGKKTVAERIFYEAMDMVKKRANDDPLKVFKKAMENVKPILEVKTRRVGGANYQVPVEVNRNRQQSLSIRWLILYAQERGEKSMEERLANELIDASNNRGGAIKKKEDVHRMAEANKAFAHYRW